MTAMRKRKTPASPDLSLNASPKEQEPSPQGAADAKPAAPAPQLGPWGLWCYETVDEEGRPELRAFPWTCGYG